jgi:hypothetical protein
MTKNEESEKGKKVLEGGRVMGGACCLRQRDSGRVADLLLLWKSDP